MNLAELLGFTKKNNNGLSEFIENPSRYEALTGNEIKARGKSVPVETEGKSNIPIELVQVEDPNRERYEIEKLRNPKLSLAEHIFGAEIPKDISRTSAKIEGNKSSFNTPLEVNSYQHKNGFLEDLQNGFKENLTQKFDVKNWDNKGEGKGIATRIGEGLGSVIKFADSPSGRGLITSGTVLALGGNIGEALGYGLNTGNRYKRLETETKAYRDMLERQGFDTSKLGNGWINRDIANTIAQNNYREESMQVRRDIASLSSNTQRARMIASMLNNATILPTEAKELLNQYGITAEDLRQSNQTRNANNYEQSVKQNGEIGWYNAESSRINSENNSAMIPYKIDEIQTKIEKAQSPYQKEIKENEITLERINQAIEAVNKNSNAFSIKNVLPGQIINRLDLEGTNARTLVDQQTAIYRKWLTGVQSSGIEIKQFERFLPSPGDNADIILAKLEGMKNSIEQCNKIYERRTNNSPKQGTTKSGIKYTVRD